VVFREGRKQPIRHTERNGTAVLKGWAGLLAEQQGACLVTPLSSMTGRAELVQEEE